MNFGVKREIKKINFSSVKKIILRFFLKSNRKIKPKTQDQKFKGGFGRPINYEILKAKREKLENKILYIPPSQGRNRNFIF